MEEITIDDYVQRINSKMVNQLSYSITNMEEGKKRLKVSMDNLIVLETELMREGTLYYHIIPGKNIKLIYYDFM